MKNKSLAGIFLLFISITGCQSVKEKNSSPSKLYSPVSQALYDTIARMDSLLFAAFNAHDAGKSMEYFSDSLEFYHDQGGLADFESTKTSITSLFENNKTTGLRRDLVKGSMEVYPIKDFGAVQTGLHTFCHKENGKDDCGTFKFIHLWQQKNGQWKLARVISYDHK